MTFDDITSQLANFVTLSQANISITLSLVGSLWIIQFINVMLKYRLNFLGIYPRTLHGLIGIPCYTFLHANFNHLFFNTIPLLLLINFMLLAGMQKFICASVTIILVSGVLIWLLGRRAIHIGASCLVMGYWGYLLVDAYSHPSIITIALALICLYYFGGLLLNIFPREERVSWEGHLFGLLAGFFAVYWCN